MVAEIGPIVVVKTWQSKNLHAVLYLTGCTCVDGIFDRNFGSFAKFVRAVAKAFGTGMVEFGSLDGR